MFLWEDFWQVEIRKWPISFHSSPDINFISLKIQAQSFIIFSLDSPLVSEGYQRLNRHWFCSLLWCFHSSKLPIDCWFFWCTFHCIVLKNHFLKFLLQYVNTKFSLFDGPFGYKNMAFFASVGVAIVRKSQKSPKNVKFVYAISFLFITTGLI